MKRKMRKFRLGGGIDGGYEENPPGMTSYSDGKGRVPMSNRRNSDEDKPMTFKQAFAEARAKKQDTFTFKNPKTGKMERFHTRTKEEESKPNNVSNNKLKEVTETKTSEIKTPVSRSVAPKRKLPENYSPRVGSGRYNDPTTTYGERLLSPLKKLTDIFGLREEESVMRNMGVNREEARRRLDAKEKAEEGMRRGGKIKKMASGGSFPDLTGDGKVTRADVLKGRGVFNQGGRVKRYASGGSVSSASKRADGCATKGKTRGKFI